MVQVVKKGLHKQVCSTGSASLSLQHRLYNILFSLLNIPSTSTGLAPVELFLMWKPRTRLSLLKPSLNNKMQGRQTLQEGLAATDHLKQRHQEQEGQEKDVSQNTRRGERTIPTDTLWYKGMETRTSMVKHQERAEQWLVTRIQEEAADAEG
ncbi:hypothetical protein PR048_016217 [Dryococelus australis]|uniref:Uncharacterized protein n=1 Tax=Dryococelus australis TaxID=614101 RepID=A0ABQ9HJA0_9NEOP|nr:hypothetical protein PR048_016217 [Dryococelus australis]